MADVQYDPADELVWDLRALEAADLVTDERAQGREGVLPIAAPEPRRRVPQAGDLELARTHLELGRAALCVLCVLGDDGNAQTVTDGLDRLADQLGMP